jgi:hypothetical protein
VADTCGVVVQLSARKSATNAYIVARSLCIVAEACPEATKDCA